MKFDSPLIRFIQQEGSLNIKKLLLLSALVGICSTLSVAIINESAQQVSKGNHVTLSFFAFLLVILLFTITLRKSTQANVVGTQTLIHRFKMKVMKHVITADLGAVDSIGRSEILQILIRDSQMVSQSVALLATTCQALAITLFMIGYLLTQSVLIFLIVLISVLLIVIFMSRSYGQVRENISNAWHKEGLSFEIFTDFLTGFKEIKMNSLRGSEITADLVSQSRLARDIKTHAMISMGNFGSNMQIISYVIIGVIVFIAPILSKNVATEVMTATTTVLFLAGSVTMIISALPTLSQANASALELEQLEKRLSLETRSPTKDSAAISYPDIASIRLEDISYTYPSTNGDSAFLMGPVSYEFLAGHVYFIRGNNGSGKSTLMRTLIGLSNPDSGRIYINDKMVQLPANSNYRDKFSVVFSDFHLFKRLYGVSNFSTELFDEVVKILEMEGKIELHDKIFSNLNLSTGQKKRIALLVALLEGKSVIVLDEWASDQDPEFRKHFYEEIIPGLRSIGKTIIAITHDDQYFEVADHMLTMDQGKLRVEP